VPIVLKYENLNLLEPAGPVQACNGIALPFYYYYYYYYCYYWKVVGSIPDGAIGIFHCHNPSGRTMALGLTQPLTEMSTRNIFWGVKAAGA